MREIVGQMKLEDMVSDRQKFAELVKANAEPDLAGMGLDIVSFNVQNFIDDNQVIENLGALLPKYILKVFFLWIITRYEA